MRYKVALSWLFILSLLSPQGSSAQLCFPAKKIYAYFQPVRKGAVSKEESTSNASSGNYYVFVESKKSDITLKHIWINGLLNNGNLKEVKTPVVLSEAGGKGPYMKKGSSLEMVPATKRKVYQVIFTALEHQNGNAIPPKFSTKPLVVELEYRKKKKYFALDKINPVPVASMY